MIKKKVKTYDDEDDWAGGGDDWNYNVKVMSRKYLKLIKKYLTVRLNP